MSLLDVVGAVALCIHARCAPLVAAQCLKPNAWKNASSKARFEAHWQPSACGEKPTLYNFVPGLLPSTTDYGELQCVGVPGLLRAAAALLGPILIELPGSPMHSKMVGAPAYHLAPRDFFHARSHCCANTKGSSSLRPYHLLGTVSVEVAVEPDLLS